MTAPLRRSPKCSWLAAFAALAAAGCDTLVCGPGQLKKFDDASGRPQCVEPSAKDTPCDVDAGALLVGGVCVGDKNKFPSCGPGTKLDPTSNQCLPDVVAPCSTAPPCAAADKANGFCVRGVVRYLKDDTCTAGKTFEVRAYDPLQFLSDPKNAKPQLVTMTDATGGYKLGNLVDQSGQALVAIAVTDPGGPSMYILSGSGARNVSKGNEYRVDPFAIETSLVAAWDTQVGLAGNNTFEMTGAYLARYYTSADETKAVSGVKLTYAGMTPANTYYFKGSLATLDKTLTATDAVGAAISRPISA